MNNVRHLLRHIMFDMMLLFSVFLLNAQSSDNPLIVRSKTYNLFTTEEVRGPKVSLLSLPDSATVNEVVIGSLLNGEFVPTNDLRILLKDRTKKYLLKVEKEGFITEYIPVDPSKAGKNQADLSFDPIYLEPEGRELKEVTVTASKVKFYHRGDTLVYNADAFVLPEGSMLDALLEQLPGVKMDDDGIITVDGKKLEYLLLDGKEFFSNDRKLMLKNIASYTVKTVDVYESHDERYDAARPGQEKLMMDVKLKKEYQKGYVANLEAGYGTSDRWLGRIFGMVYTNKLRLSLIGNANNLNDERRPSRDGAWSPDNIQAGEKKTARGALDYYYDGKEKYYTVNGTVDITHADFDNQTSRNITSFLPSGNRYGYDFLNETNKGLKLETWHRFFMEKTAWLFDAFARYNYGKTKSEEKSSSVEFTNDVQGINDNDIRDLYTGNGTLLSSVVNRVLSSDFISSHLSKGELSLRYKYKFLKYGSGLEMRVNNTYTVNHTDRNQDYILNIGQNPQPADRLEREFHNHPDHKYQFDVQVNWEKKLGGHVWWYEMYSFNHDQSNSTSEAWLLTESLSSGDYTSASMRENRPSMEPDYAAGFRSVQRDKIHKLVNQLEITAGRWFWQIKLPVRVADRTLWYTRNLKESNPKSTDVSVTPYVWMYYILDPKTYNRISLRYEMSEWLCDMVNKVDIPNTTDPLNIFIGNPGLKNTTRHDVALSADYRKGKTGHDFSASYYYRQNAVVRGFSYDPATGVRTFTPMNIDGNNEWRASYSFDVSFGHMDRFSLSNSLEFIRLTNYDFVSEEEIEMTKSRVRTLTFRDRPKLSYGLGGSKVTLFGDLAISRYTGSLSSFEAFNAGTVNYGVSGTFKLPFNFGITTDFTIYMRRGYNDHALNTNNYVWNARLSYGVPKAHLLFMLDGWDLLHDIKNVSYIVNSQGRTETYTTILPRYVMLHVQWNFNKQPKKK